MRHTGPIQISPKIQEVPVKRLFTSLSGLAALAVLSLAHTANAAAVGSLECTESNGNDVSFNVSYFTFGVTDTASVSTGTGAGKATFQPLDVHAALTTFATLFTAASEGSHFGKCTLTTTLSDGTTAMFLFKTVLIKALTAVAEKTGTRDQPAQYTDIQFEYLAVEVKTSGGTDDGGTTPALGRSNQTMNSSGGDLQPY